MTEIFRLKDLFVFLMPKARQGDSLEGRALGPMKDLFVNFKYSL
jgi:hypothetical protein